MDWIAPIERSFVDVVCKMASPFVLTWGAPPIMAPSPLSFNLMKHVSSHSPNFWPSFFDRRHQFMVIGVSALTAPQLRLGPRLNQISDGSWWRDYYVGFIGWARKIPFYGFLYFFLSVELNRGFQKPGLWRNNLYHFTNLKNKWIVYII